jgi:hypothetical protein
MNADHAILDLSFFLFSYKLIIQSPSKPNTNVSSSAISDHKFSHRVYAKVQSIYSIYKGAIDCSKH